MKHANNIRDKTGPRADNAEAEAKRAAKGEKGVTNMDKKKGPIEIGKGTEYAGVGVMRSSAEAVAHSEEAVSGKRAGANENKAWIKGSSETKKKGGSQNVKGKL